MHHDALGRGGSRVLPMIRLLENLQSLKWLVGPGTVGAYHFGVVSFGTSLRAGSPICEWVSSFLILGGDLQLVLCGRDSLQGGGL